MNNFRVIKSGNSSDGFIYRIEDVYQYLDAHPEVHPFVIHDGGIATACSVEELRERLKEMIEACDKPCLVFRKELVELTR